MLCDERGSAPDICRLGHRPTTCWTGCASRCAAIYERFVKVRSVGQAELPFGAKRPICICRWRGSGAVGVAGVGAGDAVAVVNRPGFDRGFEATRVDSAVDVVQVRRERLCDQAVKGSRSARESPRLTRSPGGTSASGQWA
jgi:hypothetical protein